MRYGELFAGAGGFSIGFEASGMSCEFQVEIDKTASAVLARHWPNVPRREDVRECGKRNLPRVDVLTFGFPCQDLSIAGQRKGLQGGTRSGLFYEAVRIGVELRCQFLVWENVPGLLSSDDGRDFARVLRHLADCDFHGGCRVLDAQHFGLAQRRKRVFGVFARGRFGAERCAEVLALREGVQRDHSTRGEAGGEVAGTLGGGSGVRGWCNDLDRCGAFISQSVTSKWAKGSGGPAGDECQNLVVGMFTGGGTLRGHGTSGINNQTVAAGHVVAYAIQERACSENLENGPQGKGYQPDLAYTLEARHHSQGVAIAFTQNQREEVREVETAGALPVEPGMHQQTFLADRLGVRRLTPRECERLQGWPDDHTRYRADGSEIADGPRYRLVGNGVAAPCVEWIGRRLMAT